MYFAKSATRFRLPVNFDYVLFSLVIIISTVGILVVSSATLSWPDSGLRIMISQLIGLAVGIVTALVLSRVDYKNFKSLGIVLYIISVAMLILVLAIGTGEQLGSRSWLKIGAFTFQPSEIAKISLIVTLATFLTKFHEEKRHKIANAMKLCIYPIILITLVIAQRDYGTTMVFIFILIAMLFVYGIRYRYILGLILTIVTSFPFLWIFALNEKRRDRIRAFFNPDLDPGGANFNVIRSKIAIGSGQIWGKGLYHGIQTQSSSVPVKESDFIFSVIGEEFGFIGAFSIITLITLLILRCIYLAKSTRDIFGKLLITGVCSLIAFHFIENIGMAMGLLPVTGIPLPFISAGGSAMFTNYMAIGIVLSVCANEQANRIVKPGVISG